MQKKSWQKFELNAEKYLNEIFEGSGISFEMCGGSDSTVSDISVEKDKKHSFYIECKLGSSQAAQFVVRNDTRKRTFTASSRNKGKGERWNKIIAHMNNDYEYYGSKETVALRCKRTMMIESIRGHYKGKAVKFFIASKQASGFPNNFIKVIDIETFEDDFEISGVYRPKRSGTGDLPKKDFDHFNRTAKKVFRNPKLAREGKRTLLTIDQAPKDLYLGDRRYYLSKEADGLYRVKRTSNIINSNVIFTLTFDPADRDDGINTLKREIDKLD